MVEFKRKQVMNIIFNHMRFSRLGGTGYQTTEIDLTIWRVWT